MSLAQSDLQQIGEFVKQNVFDWMRQERPYFFDKGEGSRNSNTYEIEIRERIVRVEEELKHQRELLIEGFKMMEKRFEAVDKRFESMQKQMAENFKLLTTRIDRFMIWSFAMMVSIASIAVTVSRLLK